MPEDVKITLLAFISVVPRERKAVTAFVSEKFWPAMRSDSVRAPSQVATTLVSEGLVYLKKGTLFTLTLKGKAYLKERESTTIAGSHVRRPEGQWVAKDETIYREGSLRYKDFPSLVNGALRPYKPGK